MNKENIESITIDLCYSMLGNINNNIKSVSFSCINEKEVTVKFILSSKSEFEDELIDDTICEFEVLRNSFLIDVEVEVHTKKILSNLEHVVFAAYIPMTNEINKEIY